MAKNRNKSSNNNAANPVNSTQHGTMAQIVQKAISSVSTVQSLVQTEKPGQALLNLGQLTPEKIDKADAELKAELQHELESISDYAKVLNQLTADLVKRTEDHGRKEDAFIKRNEENKKRIEDITKQEEDLKKRQIDLNKTASEQADKERTLEQRELDARTGFTAQNITALSDFKKEITELESRKITLQLDIHKGEQKILDDDSDRMTKLLEQEAEIAAKERKILVGQRRLETEGRELERERTQIRQEVFEEASLEITRLTDASHRAKSRLETVYRDWTLAEQKLEEYQEVSDVLAGRSAKVLLDELAAYKRQITQLENKIANSQDDQLSSENEILRKSRDELKIQLDELHIQAEESKAQLHRLRIGVTDKENLERVKRALEKHNQILGAKLNDLGQAVDDLTKSQQSDKPFPQMSWMDSALNSDWIKANELSTSEQPVPNLKEFSTELQHRIASAEEGSPLYFQLEDIQLLIAGLAMSQLHIFQGISGTGKTSLAKAFAKAIGGHSTDIAVQAGWRDRDDLLGHYNAFEKRFYERDCLQGLYRAQTNAYKDRCNIILLDEMNLSRPEQYFAEFLSALEKNDTKERLISLSESQLPNAPVLLVEGRKIRVPKNIWFIGTANHDETTNEFADKTYDRAHVMTLPRHEASFKIDMKPKASYSFTSLIERFNEAVTQNKVEVEEMLAEITNGPFTAVLQDRFDIGWGNRFERQAMRFVPVYMAAGGRKEDALDHLLASRVFRRGKVTGRYNGKIDDLEAIKQALTSVWKGWKSKPHRSVKLLDDDCIRIRKERGE